MKKNAIQNKRRKKFKIFKERKLKDDDVLLILLRTQQIDFRFLSLFRKVPVSKFLPDSYRFFLSMVFLGREEMIGIWIEYFKDQNHLWFQSNFDFGRKNWRKKKIRREKKKKRTKNSSFYKTIILRNLFCCKCFSIWKIDSKENFFLHYSMFVFFFFFFIHVCFWNHEFNWKIKSFWSTKLI